MHVEKRHAVAFREGSPLNVQQLPANFAETPDRDMSGNERVRHARQSPLLQMNIRAAHLGEFHVQQRGVLFQLRLRHLAQLDGRVRFGDQRGEHFAHGIRLRLFSLTSETLAVVPQAECACDK
jgi:hypothetical protein